MQFQSIAHTQEDIWRYTCIVFAASTAVESWSAGRISSSFLTSLPTQGDSPPPVTKRTFIILDYSSLGEI